MDEDSQKRRWLKGRTRILYGLSSILVLCLIIAASFSLKPFFGAHASTLNNCNTAVTQWCGQYQPYKVGETVTYTNSSGITATYTCIQAHVSEPDWTPEAAASLWMLASSTGTATALADPSSGSSTTSSYVPGTDSKIALSGNDADTGSQSPAVTIALNKDTQYTLSMADVSHPSFSLASNDSTVYSYELLDGTNLILHGLQPGRASLRIIETTTNEVRYLGVRVLAADGKVPGMPAYLSVGSVSEDTTADLDFWHSYASDQTNKRIDVRYIYINGGPVNGWRTWGTSDGSRAVNFIRESKKMGIIPYFVYYNIPDSSESYDVDKEHVNDPTYLSEYFKDLQFFLGIVRQEGGDDPVGIVLEPDFIGYMMQNSNGKTPIPLDQLSAATSAAYSSGVLSTSAGDPSFPDTIQGFIKAVNYIVHKDAPNALFGWQFNLWASPGITTNIPSNGLMHITDTKGIAAGRTAIVNEAQAVASYYMNGGITSSGASFISIDKYGLDGAALGASDPTQSPWFWNADQWNNYLLYTKTLHTAIQLPVILWQLPVGHINASQAQDPYTTETSNGLFPPLDDTATHYEDSASTFFLGDTFKPASQSLVQYFSTNLGNDPGITSSGDTVTWGSHMQEAVASGVTSILFGAAVGQSTQGIGSPPTDGYWWISQVQKYYENPVPLATTTG